MKSLVTGGAGFIGSHVAKHCLAMGQEVTVLDDLSGGFEDNVPKGAEFIKGSVTDENLIRYLFEHEKYDYVYHLAAYAAEGLSHFIRKFNYTNNLLGSINLINESVKHDIKCFVFTSSIAVYGSRRPPMYEGHTPSPEDPYGIAKYAVEMDLQSAHELFGLNYVIFRPHNVYGENQNIGDKYRNVVGIFMNQIMKGEALTIFGDGTQKRGFSYIDDVAPHIAQSVENPKAINEIINIGSDYPHAVNKLAEVVSKAFGVDTNIEYLPERSEVKNAYANHSKAKWTFGIEDTIELEEGIGKMSEWAKKVGARKSQSFKNIEINKNMPPSWNDIIR